MNSEFSTTTTGKWILAGEHSVLRGHPALVFPLTSCEMNLHYLPSDQDLQIRLEGQHGGELEVLVWGVLQKAAEMSGVLLSNLRGTLSIKNSIPLGAGLGASAAICVAVARFFLFLKNENDAGVTDFACKLENLFHGESSGVDVAVVASARPLKYYRGKEVQFLDFKHQSLNLFISYSGQRGMTADCVQQVKDFISNNPSRGNFLDQQMREAVQVCESAFARDPNDKSIILDQLKQGLALANACFSEWGLCVGMLADHIEKLKNHGAVAVKPTGSGKGGYALSLWSKKPDNETIKALGLISCF